ncbi:peptidylprolyl isomerase [Candidatus Pelagibacter sp.]|nr:peptidylprolyl isomerase [Candidatus Pelagibacter sp.]
MIKNKISLLILIIFYIISFASPSISNSIFIVAKVNNSIITNIDIIKEANYLRALNPDLKKLKNNEILKIAKNSMLREKIKEGEISKYLDLNNENPMLKSTIINIYSRLNFKSETEFEEYLNEFDLTLDIIKKKINVETTWNQLIFERYKNLVKVNKERITEQAKMNVSNSKQNLYLVSEILFNDTSKVKIDEKYQIILNSINEIGFKNTAAKYSISDSKNFGGELGWISENQLSKGLKEILYNLKIGEFSDPINIPGGRLILMLNDRNEETINLDLQNEIKTLIAFEKDRKLNQFSTIYFNKVKMSAKITYEK